MSIWGKLKRRVSGYDEAIAGSANNLSWAESVGALGNSLQERAERSIVHASRMYGVPLEQLRTDIGTFTIQDKPNNFANRIAYSQATEKADVSIDLDWLRFVLCSTTLFSATTALASPSSEEAVSKEKPLLSPRQTVLLAARMINAFTGDESERVTLHERFSDVIKQFSEGRALLQTGLLEGANNFIVGHEVGRVMIALHPDIEARASGLELAREWADKDVEAKWAVRFGADVIALNVSLMELASLNVNRPVSDRAFHGMLTCASVELARIIREGADFSDSAGDRSVKLRGRGGQRQGRACATRNLTGNVSATGTRTPLRRGDGLARGEPSWG